jgi:thymidylate synthase ThyX
VATIDFETLFHQLDGNESSGFPTIHSPVHHSPGGVPYLTKPGAVLLARPNFNMGGMVGFLNGFDPSLHFAEYVNDPTNLPDGAQLCKVAGQICYMSLGQKRTLNAQAERYFNNLKSSGHGSVFEHATFSFLLYGISRSVTHEMVRHRAGFGFCLTGDTLIYSIHQIHGKPDGVRKRRLDDLYAMTQTSHGRSRIKLLRLRCLDETTGTFVASKVKQIICSGVKPVFAVTLADGKTITATKEHRFLTKDGWLPLEKIVGGLSVSKSGFAIYEKLDAEIMVNGQPMYKEADWLHEHYVIKKLSQRPRKPRLIPKPVRIVAITYAGEQMTYDIEMEGPHHNFIANGIITHNSQLSQRYVSGRMLRFVERPEYQDDEDLHSQFLQRIERAASEYATLTNRLLEMQQAGVTILSAEAKTDLRKKVQQTARSVLPNETETVIVTTGNARAWRHFMEMRASAHAETEIRELAVRIFLCLRLTDPVLFSDYTLEQISDGTYIVKTEFEKV